MLSFFLLLLYRRVFFCALFLVFENSLRQVLSFRTIAQTFLLWSSLQLSWLYCGHSGWCFDILYSPKDRKKRKIFFLILIFMLPNLPLASVLERRLATLVTLSLVDIIKFKYNMAVLEPQLYFFMEKGEKDNGMRGRFKFRWDNQKLQIFSIIEEGRRKVDSVKE